MSPRSKYHSRDYLFERWHAVLWGPWPSSGPYRTRTYFQTWSDDLLISQSNPFWVIGKVRGAIGGDFWVLKRSYSESSTLGSGRIHFSPTSNPLETGRHHIHGPQFAEAADFNVGKFPVVTPSPDHVLDAFGAEAIAETRPTKPETDLGTFLGELREGLPRVVGFSRTGKQRVSAARKGGSEYLNVEFGWKPLKRDIQAFANVIKNSERLLDEYIANAGLRHKVKKEWPPEISTTRTVLANQQPLPLLETWAYSGTGYRGPKTIITRNSRKMWFEAVFRYHVPEVGTFQRRTAEANKLLGVDIDAETVWNLAPWSWAADWFTNMGAIAANMSAFHNEGLVLEYGYMMEEKSTTRSYTLTGIRYTSYPGSQTLSQTFETTSKRRVTANPYGFGVTNTELSDSQLAILVALGLSRGP